MRPINQRSFVHARHFVSPGEVPGTYSGGSKATRRSSLILLALVTGLSLCLLVGVPGRTRLALTDADTGRHIIATTLRDGDQVTLTWTNSIYRIPVTEVYIARAGWLVQDQVIIGDDADAPDVGAADVADFYHTGDAFSARSLDRPFARVVFRIGEIGEPHLSVRGHTFALKQAVGFGGRVILAARHARLHDLLAELLYQLPVCRSAHNAP